MRLKHQQTGFANIVVLLLVLVIVVGASAVLWRVTQSAASNNAKNPNEKSDIISSPPINKKTVEFTPLENLDESPYKNCNYGQPECIELKHTVKGKKIFILLGERANGSHGVMVTRVEETDRALIVHIEETTAGDGCGSLTVMGYPSTAIELKDDIKKPVELLKTTKKSPKCS